MRPVLFWQFVLGIVFMAHAQELRLPACFTDNMVLQRDAPVSLWGWSAPGQEVKVEMDGSSQQGKTGKDGIWKVRLPAFPAGGPHTVKISAGTSVVELDNVLMGDVWLCGGQSNMEWPLKQTPYREEDTVWLQGQQVRLLKVIPEMDYRPGEDIHASGWMVPEPDKIAEFSAVGYHFGKFIQQESGVPIGLVSVNLGATAVETWMSNEALEAFPQFREELKHTGSFADVKKAFEKNKKSWYGKYYYTGPGISGKWYLPETDITSWDTLEVAGNTWEEEETLKDFDGAVWFRRSFDLPEGFEGDSLPLQLLQIDDYDITWVNGHRIGETFGRHNHRNYTIPAGILKKKGNILTVRVFDTGGTGGFTTPAFWGNDILRGRWHYRKGLHIDAGKFPEQELVNVTPFSSPGVLYNANVAPLTALKIKGVIWYQGESNAARAAEYRELFPALIRDWRDHFGKDIPFLWVQLANYGQEPEMPGPSAWAELREAQDMALNLPNTAMAVTIDIGEAGDIHPRNKLDVGKRLGALAMNLCYGGTYSAQFPQFKDMERKGDSLLVRFTAATPVLKTKDKYGYIRGFQLAGEDGEFRWARAFLRKNTVVVYAPGLRNPVAVRYAWSDNPGPLDLTGENGLPAAPFRSDDRKLSTDGLLFDSKVPRF
ncbi:sialate O-acetylesterase [Sinomicrobium soli]|uniref:sialate O-acetylesterase n=1 Tax=Sinomicrobium sp. N-1-3-6 TaxID=2219864 RepID=UPI000DCAF16C|nr:sialate O-acetylesterase [Sinomicrobium sp. N-1-3-6]RAV30507.1 9-O-acetylesterase [Sinomicrobium sp. N-1-3-6]